MKISIWPMTVCMFLLLSGAHAGSTDSNSGNWIVERCAAYRGGYCRVPFHVALLGGRELASQTSGVQLRGYMVKEPDGYALYESKESAQRGWRTDAILIQPPLMQEIATSLVRRNQSLVVVKGRVVLVASDHDEYWMQLILEAPVTIAAVVGEKLKR